MNPIEILFMEVMRKAIRITRDGVSLWLNNSLGLRAKGNHYFKKAKDIYNFASIDTSRFWFWGIRTI
jgi:hypothetical protein